MVFYDSTNKTGLVDDFFFFIFGNSDDHTSEIPLADVCRLINMQYDTATVKILQADSQWEWDDNNKADLPISRVDLLSGRQNYGVSAVNYLKVGKIDVQDSQGNWTRLRQFQEDELSTIADDAFYPTNGTPQYYRLQANSVFLYPSPNYDLTQGLRIFYQRSPDYFTAGNTVQENAKVPGFVSTFHRILSIGAALDYAMTAGMSGKVSQLQGRMTAMLQDLEIFYSTRNDNKLSMKTHRTDYGEIGLGSIGYNRGSYNERGFF